MRKPVGFPVTQVYFGGKASQKPKTRSRGKGAVDDRDWMKQKLVEIAQSAKARQERDGQKSLERLRKRYKLQADATEGQVYDAYTADLLRKFAKKDSCISLADRQELLKEAQRLEERSKHPLSPAQDNKLVLKNMGINLDKRNGAQDKPILG